jgi:chromosome segregation ATPase
MPDGSPINDILQMRQQGLSNNQIIQNLQRTGYSNTQIFDAMNQADTKMAVEGMQPVFEQPPMDVQNHNFHAPENNTMESHQDIRELKEMHVDNSAKIEELVETIVEEKWEDLLRDVNKIVEWKNKLETRLTEMEIKLDNLKENFSDLQRAVVGKVNDYDKHIQEVGSEIQAMEKVFSKVLPVFTENVNELSSIARKMKEDKK